MSYATEVKLLTAWLILAFLAAVVLMVVLLVRKPPEPAEFWRTTRRYFLLSCLICTFLPTLLLIVTTAGAVYEWASPTILGYWWAPLIVLCFVVVAIGGWLLWRYERGTDSKVVNLPEIPPMTAPVATMGWSLPPDANQWSAPTQVSDR